MIRRVLRKLNKTISGYFFLDQWVIMTGPHRELESLQWSGFRPIVPPADRYWADPFVIERDGQICIFIEEKLYATGLGRIACMTLDAKGDLQSIQTVLEQPYHLSYPFLFEYGGELLMLPETAQNGTLDVYRCLHFPDQWELAQTLMRDVYAVDATLLEHGGKWWLFANMKQKVDDSSLDRLFLFYADMPLTADWTPHPLNPVVDDIRSARPAGRILKRTDSLLRPSQDCSRRYGYALNINRITKLSETEYEETRFARLEPPRGSKTLAVHTYNETNNQAVIDAVVRRRK